MPEATQQTFPASPSPVNVGRVLDAIRRIRCKSAGISVNWCCRPDGIVLTPDQVIPHSSIIQLKDVPTMVTIYYFEYP